MSKFRDQAHRDPRLQAHKMGVIEFREAYLKAVTDWPGVVDAGEREPDKADLDEGWANIQRLEAEWTAILGAKRVETLGTGIFEAVADLSRLGLTRSQIRRAVSE